MANSLKGGYAMNLPNKLTLLRIGLTPFFLFFLLCSCIPGAGFWALSIFIAASVTDALDGHIARSRGMVTDFGKFLDPVADKVLTFAALIAFVELGLASSAAVVLMMAREFLVSSLRMVAAGHGRVLAAGNSGKVKTAVTMVVIVFVLLLRALGGLLPEAFPLATLSHGLVWICAALTLWSGAEYLWKNRSEFAQTR